MTKRKKSILAVIVIAMVVLLGVTFASAAEFNVKFSTYFSPSMAGTFIDMGKNIEKMSNGRIKLTVFSGGELVSSSDALKAVRGGTLQMAHTSGYHNNEVKEGPIEAGLPMTWANQVETEVLWHEMGFGELVAKAYDKAGVRYVAPVFAGPYAITTKTPVKSLADLQKMKLRATSGPSNMFKAVGVASVYMKPEEMYLAVSTGQIDGVLYGSVLEYKELSMFEVAPYYCTSVIVSPIVDNIIISKKFYSKLPDDLKAIIDMAAYRAGWKFAALVMGAELKTLGTVYAGKTTQLDPESIAKITAAGQAVWADAAKVSPLAGEMVEMIKQMLKSAGRL